MHFSPLARRARRSLALLGSAAALAAAGSGCGLSSSWSSRLLTGEARNVQSDALLRRAVEAFKQGDTNTAHKLLEDAVVWRGGDIAARAEVAQAVLGYENASAALRFLQPVLSDARPSGPLPFGVLALAAHKVGDAEIEKKAHARAEAAADAIRKRFGKWSAEPRERRDALALVQELGEYERLQGPENAGRAIAAYREGTVLFKRSPLALTRYGRALADLGTTDEQRDEAVRKTLEAIQYSHEDEEPGADEVEMLDAYAWALCQRNVKTDLIGARRILSEIAEREPGNAAIHYHLAVVHQKEGFGDRMAIELERALWLRPDYPEAAELKRRVNPDPPVKSAVPSPSPTPTPAPTPSPSPAPR